MSFNRYKASGLHFCGSLCVALIAAALVFLLWYPEALAGISGVSGIFLLMLGVDAILGPCITLLIFSPGKKPMREIRRDLAIVLCVQLAALSFGMYTVFAARPVFLVYSEGGSFEVTHANDLTAEKLARGREPQFRTLPQWGPKLAALDVPKDPKIRQGIMTSLITGEDRLAFIPQAYVAYERRKPDVIKHLKPLEALRPFNKARGAELDALIRKYASRQVGWLPMQGKNGYLAVVIARDSAEILEVSTFLPL